MGDEWVCQDCNYGTDDKLSKDECPLCKGSMVNIGSVEDDLKDSKKDSDDYDDDELDTSIDESLDDDIVDDEDLDNKK